MSRIPRSTALSSVGGTPRCESALRQSVGRNDSIAGLKNAIDDTMKRTIDALETTLIEYFFRSVSCASSSRWADEGPPPSVRTRVPTKLGRVSPPAVAWQAPVHVAGS